MHAYERIFKHPYILLTVHLQIGRSTDRYVLVSDKTGKMYAPHMLAHTFLHVSVPRLCVRKGLCRRVYDFVHGLAQHCIFLRVVLHV